MAMANMSQQTAALNQSVQGLGTAARNASANMDDLADSVFGYGKALFTLSSYDLLKGAFNWIKKFSDEQKLQLHNVRERFKIGQDSLDQERQKLAFLQAATVRDTAAIAMQRSIVRDRMKEMVMLNDEKMLREGISDLVQKNFIGLKLSASVLSGITTLWFNALKNAHDYNRALMQANTSLKERFALVEKMASVQAATGLDTESMVDATRSLVEYGQDLTPQFQDHVKLVGMMSQGLGVSADTAAEMVVVFSRQLKTGAQSVADVVAQVAAQTGLAAEKAAAFATEIGRALRLLGSSKTESAGVVRVITALAGRVQELGGNAQSVVNAYRRMSGGSSEAFFMRGLAGVGSPGQLGTGPGAEQAMQGLSRRISSMLTAPEGNNMYAAQLEAVAEITGMTTNELLDFQQAMKELNKPLTEGQSLSKAYRDQQAALGKSWTQIRESLQGLMTGALAPFMKIAADAAASLADFVRSISGNKGIMWVFRIGIPLAAGIAVASLTALGWQIMRLALTSKFASSMMGQNFPQLTGWMAKLRAGGAVGGAAGLGAGSVIGAGALGLGLGVGAGVLADKIMDKYTWTRYLTPLGYLKIISQNIGEMTVRARGYDTKSTAFFGPNKLDETVKATNMLTDYLLGKPGATKEGYLTQLGVALSTATDDADRRRIPDYVKTVAARNVQNEIYLREMKRMSYISPEEDAKDKEVLRKLTEEQIDLQAKIVKATQDQAENFRQFLEQTKVQIQNEFWNSTTINNRTAFQYSAPVTNTLPSMPFYLQSR